MSDDWKVGDLALCIASGEQTREGRVYTVRDILPAGVIDPEDGLSDTIELLRFVELPNPGLGIWGGVDRFRKIRPDEHEDCEPEFVTLLNRIKRKVSA